MCTLWNETEELEGEEFLTPLTVVNFRLFDGRNLGISR
jgi:hypothetical protein